jgi:hypothetical protein
MDSVGAEFKVGELAIRNDGLGPTKVRGGGPSLAALPVRRLVDDMAGVAVSGCRGLGAVSAHGRRERDYAPLLRWTKMKSSVV